MCYALFGKQESQESVKKSQNQANIPKDSRITSIKIQSCGPLDILAVLDYTFRH